ncbi:GNAT family N-acetyltransferase [Pseudoalteromonas sp. XMcav2-N-2]|uniref:GNAT family N-acetyltransferase n=1 Tax=unclassified Pseudoalteromonas TaxID=194690 RepID=UPI0032C4290C
MITLKPATKDNYSGVFALQLLSEDLSYIASPAEALAESAFFPYYRNLLIYHQQTLVGFMQYHPMEPEGTKHEYAITQLLIDKRYRRQGFATQALRALLTQLQAKSDCQVISAVYVQGNERMRALLSQLSFEFKGRWNDNACLMEWHRTSQHPAVFLSTIWHENFEHLSDLQLHEKQKPLVAPNDWTLLEAAYNPEYEIRAINYRGEQVGLIMWVFEKPHRVSIWRLMVDKTYQQQGIGRQALSAALEEIRSLPEVTEIAICYVPDNPVAKDFYASFGFVETGFDEEEEEMLAEIRISRTDQGMHCKGA